MNIYTEVPPCQIAAEKKYLLSAIYKLLPYKENNYEFLDNYFESVLQRLVGFNKISGEQPEIITIISLVEYARQENDFKNVWRIRTVWKRKCFAISVRKPQAVQAAP